MPQKQQRIFGVLHRQDGRQKTKGKLQNIQQKAMLPSESPLPYYGIKEFRIHSFSILSDDRSKASSKTMSPQSAI